MIFPRANPRSQTPQPPVPYSPPPGFEAASITSNASRSLPNHFSREALRGKQIWHITAPASVPISSIKEVPIRKLAEGGTILSYKGGDYGLTTDADADHHEEVLLVPSAQDHDYRLAEAHIERTLHLHQIVKLPSATSAKGPLANGSKKAPKTHVKMVRQQPEGLRMRYRPFGDRSSSEDINEAPRFKLPPIVSAAEPFKGEKPTAGNHQPSPTIAQDRTTARDKVKQTPKKTEAVSGASEALRLAREASFKKVSKVESRASKPDQKSPTSPKPKEIPEDKAQRRAERKRRKNMADGALEGTANQHDELSRSKKPEKKGSGVDSLPVTVQKPPEPEQPKQKRRKRKAEVLDDA